MGLKYVIFMMKTSSLDLFDRLIKFGCINETDLYLKDKKFDEEIKNELIKLKDKSINDEEKAKLWMEIAHSEPIDKELLKFRNRQKEKQVNEIEIYWKQLNEDFIFGSFTYIPIIRYKFKILVSGIFTKANLKEWIIVDYHHGSNEGYVIQLKNGKKLDAINFDIKEDEKEKWEKYAKRVGKEINYPILEMHNSIYESGYTPIDWEYSVSYKLNNKKK